jgi:hypothetical protein
MRRDFNPSCFDLEVVRASIRQNQQPTKQLASVMLDMIPASIRAPEQAVKQGMARAAKARAVAAANNLMHSDSEPDHENNENNETESRGTKRARPE